MLEIQNLVLTQASISLSILSRTEPLVTFLGCQSKSMAGTSPSQLFMCDDHMEEIHYEHKVFVGHRILAASLCCSSQWYLAVISTDEMNVIRRQRVTSSKCHDLSQNQFLHSTNIMDLFINIMDLPESGKGVSMS